MKRTTQVVVGGACVFSMAIGFLAGGSIGRSGSPARVGAASATQRAAALKVFETAMSSHAPNRPATRGVTHTVNGVTGEGSYNWAGYGDSSTTAQAFTSVSGGWTVPTLTCTTEDRIVALWVGLDGLTDSTVEQDGTSAQCFEGTAYYYSWYEMYPAGSVEVGTTVKPGDKITASVTRSGDKYALKVTDATTSGNNVDETGQTCALTTCLDESAEWIYERPAYGDTGIVPLAQVTRTAFSASEAKEGTTSGSITAFSPTWELTIIDSTSSYDLDTTGALNSTDKNFDITWLNSY